jgi:TatD DNase family protein
MTVYSDSHIHLASYPADGVLALVQRAITAGMTLLMTWGEDLASSATGGDYAAGYEVVYAGAGIHPWNAVNPTDEIKRRFEATARRHKVVAIGEIGLDWAHNPSNRETQQECMRYQVAYALKNGLSVDVHVRESHEEVMAILRPAVKAGLRGIAHGFTGSPTQLKDWLALDFYISIGVRGLVTGELPGMAELIRLIPSDRLLCETDNSDTPEHPGLTGAISVAEKIAQLKNSRPEDIGAGTTANLKRLLKIA